MRQANLTTPILANFRDRPLAVDVYLAYFKVYKDQYEFDQIVNIIKNASEQYFKNYPQERKGK